MNREILFKAKRIDNGEWLEGSLIVLDADSGYYFITEPYLSASTLPVRHLIWNHTYLVDPETLCQYTGLTDKNGEKLWENDIVEIRGEDGIFILEWQDDTARFVMNGDCLIVDFDNYWSNEVEVIGNIFDNPELLRGEDDETD